MILADQYCLWHFSVSAFGEGLSVQVSMLTFNVCGDDIPFI